MQRLRVLCIAFVLVFVLMGPIASARAAPPQFEFVEIDFIFPVEGCDFPVQAELTGTLRAAIHTDNAGNFKMLIERVLRDSQSTYTNLDTGFSISSSHGSGIDKILVEEDGTVLFVAMGIFDILPVPGQGPIVHDVGRIVVDTTTGELLFSAGQFTVHGPGGNVEALCAALQ